MSRLVTNQPLAAIAALIFTTGVVACSNRNTPAPSAPSVVSPKPAALAVFTDPVTGLSTSDVRDAQGNVVHFTTANELVWMDGTHVTGHSATGPGYRGSVNGTAEASCQCWLIVRFGAADGERRAYLTGDVGHSNPGTVVNLELADKGLVVTWSDLFPPGTYTLSGVITEATETGPVPIENAEVWRVDEEQSGWDHHATDKNGFYQLHGLSSGSRETSFSKAGYQSVDLRDVPVNGDTRFDAQLVRR